MDLRLFLVSFLTGACAVVFGAVLMAFILDSRSNSNQTGGADGSSTSGPGQGQATQLAATATVVPTFTSQPSAELTAAPEPRQPQDLTTMTPVVTSEPGASGATAAPAGLTAQYNAGQGIVLSWQAVPGAAFYNVYRSLLPGGGPAATYVALGSSGAPAFQDTTVQSGQSYFYVVTSSANGLESSTSNETVVVIP